MDDLEKAILIIFDETGSVSSNLKQQALAYCQQIKDNNASNICSICIDRLCFSSYVQVQFWSLQCLHDVLRARYGTMSAEEKNFVRKSIFALVCYENVGSDGTGSNNCVKVLDGPAYVKNKLAQVLVTLIYFEYPLIWSSVFVDFLPNLSKGGVVIDMFCRVLNVLDDELISQDYPRSVEEGAVSVKIKDAMRQQCVGQIVHAWYEIVNVYRNSDSEMCAFVLDTMRRYIWWIDIGLIANNTFLPLLFELMLVDGLPDQLRCAASGCVLAVVAKRMDPQAKLTLLQSLQMSRVFGLVAGDVDSELVSGLASLLTGYASELLDCLKHLNGEDLKRVSFELLNEVLPSVFYIMQNCEIDTTFSTVQFLSGYVSTMKIPSPLSETQLFHLGQILEVIRMQIRYDPMYRDHLDVLDKVGSEEEDRMAEHRKDLLVLLRHVGRVAPDATQIFIRNSLSSAVGSSLDINVEEVEAALSLFYAYGESLTEEAMKTGSGILRELVPMLLSTKFPCHSSRLVALVYLDTITRYMKFVLENNQYIPSVLTAFLDDRGIHHPKVKVSRRASYLFMRVVKLLKAKLVPFIVTILQSLNDKVSQFTSMDSASKELSGSEDGSHIFEAIGLLIGMEDVPLEKQSEYLSSLLKPLCQQVEILIASSRTQNTEESASKIASIQQIIMAINALSKGFSERLATASRPAIGIMFKQTLDVLLQILIIFPKVETLRSKVTSFIHRMVETLGSSVFPNLPKALEQLLAESELKDALLEGTPTFLKSFHQLVTSLQLNQHGTKAHEVNGASINNDNETYLHLNQHGTKTHEENDATFTNEKEGPGTNDNVCQDTSNEGNKRGKDGDYVEQNSETRPSNDDELYHKELNDILAKKQEFFSSICEVRERGNRCMKCNKGGELLVCSSNNCSFVFHNSCLASKSSFDYEPTGKFYCPFCRYSQALSDYWAAEKKASLARNNLVSFNRPTLNHMPKTSLNESKIPNGVSDPDFTILIDESPESSDGKESKKEDDVDCVVRFHKLTKPPNGVSNLELNEERSESSDGKGCNEENIKEVYVDRAVGPRKPTMPPNGVSSPDLISKRSESSMDIGCSKGTNKENAYVDRVVRLRERTKPTNGVSSPDLVSERSESSGGNGCSKGTNKENAYVDRAVRLRERTKPPNGVSNLKLYDESSESSDGKGCREGSNEEENSVGHTVRPRKRTLPSTSLPVPQRRRVPVPWTQSEEDALKKWVAKFTSDSNILGRGFPWSRILDLGASKFQSSRTPVDLKDKWRNMQKASKKSK